MTKELELLDRMEEIRQKAAENPADYPVDCTVRILTAMFAEYAGYERRTDWTKVLKAEPNSIYSQRLRENRFHI